jgi:predicted secreted protein
MPGALLAQGVQFKRGDGADPEVFTVVPRLFNFEINIESEEVDVTAHDSTGNWGEFLAGRHSGEITAELYYDPQDTVHAAIRTDQLDRDIVNYQVVWPTDPTITDVYALVIVETEDSWEGNGEEAAQIEITYRITGEPTFGA